MPVCDGCGAQVDEAHIRSRIERLEMATRYRPIHIQMLVLDAAPPARAEDFFYRDAADRSQRAADSRNYFDNLIRCTGEDPARFSQESEALAEFQRRGLFLTNVVECAAASEPAAALARCAASLVKRIQFSYKPKYIVPISSALQGVIPLLAGAGWADRLILHGIVPFDLSPTVGSGSGAAPDFATAVSETLTKVVSSTA